LQSRSPPPPTQTYNSQFGDAYEDPPLQGDEDQPWEHPSAWSRPPRQARGPQDWDPYAFQVQEEASQAWTPPQPQNRQARNAPGFSQIRNPYLPPEDKTPQRPKVRNPHVRHDDEDIVRPGGLVPEDERPERRPSTNYHRMVSLKGVPMLVTRARCHQKDPQRKRFTFGHLPDDALKKFGQVEALIFNALGRLDPWEIPDDGTVVQCWNSVMGEEYPIDPAGAKGEDSLEWFLMAKKLIRRLISTRWTHGLAEVACKAVKDEFYARKLDTLFLRAEFVGKILGPVDELLSFDRPFLWLSRNLTNPNDWTFARNKKGEEVEEREGMFAGCLIARTLAQHIKLTSAKVPGFSPHPQPRGALLMAVLAVHRALLYYLTGEYKPPTPRKEREFSRTNWGDYEIKVLRKGRQFRKLVKRATLFKDAVDRLEAEQWATIMAEASKYTPQTASDDDESYWVSEEEEEAVEDFLTDHRLRARG
ncbi:hypothetical protein BDN72DRAFT_866155, partial [Pluteus cervinus]